MTFKCSSNGGRKEEGKQAILHQLERHSFNAALEQLERRSEILKGGVALRACSNSERE
jgi:hypothetical protein